MAIINYSDLGLTKSKEVRIFKWNDKDIEVVKYLPIDAKYDIVMITLQEAYEEGIYNPVKLDKFFHLNLVFMYSNLVFTDKDRQDTDKLYDELKSSGFMDKFLQNINEEDYTEMLEDIDTIIKAKSTFSGTVKKLVDDLPAQAEAMQSIIDNFDPNKYQAVVDFAKAANGGREIK
jgi:hypothetical protein